MEGKNESKHTPDRIEIKNIDIEVAKKIYNSLLKLLQKFDDKKVFDYDINAHGDFCAEVVKIMDIMVGQVAEKKQAEVDRLTKALNRIVTEIESEENYNEEFVLSLETIAAEALTFKDDDRLNEISNRLYKTDYKYISLDVCKVAVLEEYAAIKKS